MELGTSEITDAAYSWGRWAAILALFALLVYRNRHSLRATELSREVAIGVAAYFCYFGVRGLTEGKESEAVGNAHTLVDAERALGIYWEPSLQSLIVDNQDLVTLANWAYIWGHWPLIIVVATWLYIHRPPVYKLFRNAVLLSGAIGLVIFALYPVAPPRLAGLGVVDTVETYSQAYRVLQPPALTNQYAAVPSLHFGWNLLLGIALVTQSRSWLGRMIGVVTPPIMLAAIIFTANHYILDAVAGAVVALSGLAIAYALTARQPHELAHEGAYGRRAHGAR